jgi:hypothetical protein
LLPGLGRFSRVGTRIRYIACYRTLASLPSGGWGRLLLGSLPFLLPLLLGVRLRCKRYLLQIVGHDNRFCGTCICYVGTTAFDDCNGHARVRTSIPEVIVVNRLLLQQPTGKSQSLRHPIPIFGMAVFGCLCTFLLIGRFRVFAFLLMNIIRSLILFLKFRKSLGDIPSNPYGSI